MSSRLNYELGSSMTPSGIQALIDAGCAPALYAAKIDLDSSGDFKYIRDRIAWAEAGRRGGWEVGKRDKKKKVRSSEAEKIRKKHS